MKAPITAGGPKYGGLELSDAKRLRQLGQEDERLKRLLADAPLERQVLQDALRRN